MDSHELAAALTLAITRLDRDIHIRQAPGVTVGELAILTHLDMLGPSTPADLTRLERIASPSMTRYLKRLLYRQLIDIVPNPADRRSALATITDAGRVQAAQARAGAWLPPQLAALLPQDQAVLEAALPILQRLCAEPDCTDDGAGPAPGPSPEPGQPEAP